VTDAARALRNVGLLTAQRAIHVAGAAIFAALVPRLMGPTLFGRYALLISVSLWFALLSGLGAVSVMTRCVPKFTADRDDEGLRKLATSLTALRFLTGTLAAAGYFLVASVVLREPDRVAGALVAAAIIGRTVSNIAFSLFLGLNEAGRWGMGDLIRRWATLALVPAGFVFAGLRGACFGIAGAEAIVLATGLWWARPYLSRAAMDLSRSYLSPVLHMGTSFAAGSLLIALTQRSGETIVRLSTGRYDEVGFFGAAYAIYLTAALAIWQATIACAPFLMTSVEGGRRDEVGAWLERLVTYSTIAGIVCLAGAVMVGPEAVPWVLGSAYGPVAASVIPLTLAMLLHAAGDVGRLLALTVDRPGIITTAAGLELAAFWGIGLPLAARAGSLGASLAALAASALYAWHITTRARRELKYSLADAGRAMALSVVFVPLALVRGAWWLNAALLASGLAAYGVLLVAFRVVTASELGTLRRLLGVQAAPKE
jgi:O-antigen/teichoic acid export membrane protein